MNTQFDALQQIAAELFPKYYGKSENGRFFVIDFTDFLMGFLLLDQTELLVRTRVCPMDQLPDEGALFEELLQGNLFYEGTRGATLSLTALSDREEGVFLTERVPIAALADRQALLEYCDGFQETARHWQARCALYLKRGKKLDNTHPNGMVAEDAFAELFMEV